MSRQCFQVEASDLFTCEYCGAENLVWVQSRRTGTYYPVHAKWDEERQVYIANRRDLHSLVCTGRAGLDANNKEQREPRRSPLRIVPDEPYTPRPGLH
jgi:hypothetical protein